MTRFVVRGLNPAPFRPLYGLPDAELARQGVVRMTADAKPGFPCRVTLEDAEPGETMLLLNYEHLPVATPYRSRHAIFVAGGSETAAAYEDRLPEQLTRRLLSLRAFDVAGMMVDAEVLDGAAAEPLVRDWLGRADVAYLHAHNAKRGCFAARIERF
jgi:hypothetical protein